MLTAEQVKAELAQAKAGGGLTADQVRRELAQTPIRFDPSQARTDEFAQREAEAGPWERFTKGIAAPVIQTGLGIYDLLGGDLSEEQQYALEATRRERGLAGTLGGVAGETAMLAVPATKGYQAGVALGRAGRAVPGLMQSAPKYAAARAAAPLAAESAVVGGMEALKAPEEGESRLERGLEAGALNLGVGAALSGLSKGYQRAKRPRTFRKSRAAMREQARLRRAGQDDFLPLYMAIDPQRAGTMAKLGESYQRKILSNLPLTGQKLATQREEVIGNYVNSVFKDIVPSQADIRSPMSRAGTSQPAKDAFKDVQNFYHKQEYPRLLDKHRFSENRVISNLSNLTTSKKLKNNMELIVKDAAEQGILSGGKLKTEVQKQLKELARRASNKGKVQQSRDYQRMSDLVEQGLMNRIRQAGPDDLRDYEALKEPYANYLVVQDTLARIPESRLEPKAVARRSRAKKGQSQAVAARGEAPLQKITERAEDIYKPLEKADNFFKTFAAGGLLAGLYGSIKTGGVLPMAGAIAAPYAGARLLGRESQRRLMSELPKQREMAKQWRRRRRAAEEVRQATGIRPGTATRLGISQYLDEEEP